MFEILVLILTGVGLALTAYKIDYLKKVDKKKKEALGPKWN